VNITMSLEQALRAVQDTPLVLALSGADPLVVQVTQIFHVLGLVLLLSSVLLFTLHQTGLALRELPVPRVSRALAPLWWGGLAVTLLSGLTLFLSSVMTYHHNRVFWPKLGLLVLALSLQVVLLQRARREQATRSRGAAAAAALSLLLWLGVGLAGRAIGFV
jgi:hypothetical protein